MRRRNEGSGHFKQRRIFQTKRERERIMVGLRRRGLFTVLFVVGEWRRLIESESDRFGWFTSGWELFWFLQIGQSNILQRLISRFRNGGKSWRRRDRIDRREISAIRRGREFSLQVLFIVFVFVFVFVVVPFWFRGIDGNNPKGTRVKVMENGWITLLRLERVREMLEEDVLEEFDIVQECVVDWEKEVPDIEEDSLEWLSSRRDSLRTDEDEQRSPSTTKHQKIEQTSPSSLSLSCWVGWFVCLNNHSGKTKVCLEMKFSLDVVEERKKEKFRGGGEEWERRNVYFLKPENMRLNSNWTSLAMVAKRINCSL